MDFICINKEQFSLEGVHQNKKETNSSKNKGNEKNEKKTTETSNVNKSEPYPNMFYMYNPMMMPPTSKDQKGQFPMYCLYPVYMDPSKMPKDMNPQNMCFYPPMMGMFPHGEAPSTHN